MMTEVGHYRGGHVRRRVVRRKYNNIILFLFTFRCLFRIGVTEQVLKKKKKQILAAERDINRLRVRLHPVSFICGKKQ